ncbi:hypothetical protein APR04_004486 [Promicromonospora umidemergens]|uniref:MoaA/NifB/PqqE/SkfB family radical SAM enzyme n=1 Tax=Promicromonospora umidemergens TaxID=629679 RepID=A0ABP8WY86_9MICO|nr:hypothetical protein [Promicromonospora umidemergens]MCP2285551.1 hypothetical protein [Promicromonospora umidemergens]
MTDRDSLLDRLAHWWTSTRPVSVESRAVLAERWARLPEDVRTPAQLLGRHAVGCEGTHGVFPKCNLTCTPCYHSADANKVRIDAEHTLTHVEAQLAYLRRERGPRAHTQLIGGEVTLLDPDTHAEALLIMRRHGREPMSFTHGDVDEDYLRKLVRSADGTVRLPRVSFAGHFDSLMRGRRGLPRPRSEAELAPFRREFTEMFSRLRRDLGVRSYLAHNMTVTPANLDEVADVVRQCRPLGFSMLSFQPAAYLGDSRRWREDLRSATPDAVWSEIERGAGARLPWQVLQFGDPRCNRTAYGWRVGERWVPLLDDTDPADLAVRDAFLERLGGMQVGATPARVLVPRLLRALAANPALFAGALGWARRAVRRSGGPVAVARNLPRPLTFVMHNFMDAADVAPAWELLEQGVLSADPGVRATQDRLRACSYTMAHPDTDRLVPACVQHGVLDPGENVALRRLLPLVDVTSSPSRGRPP